MTQTKLASIPALPRPLAPLSSPLDTSPRSRAGAPAAAAAPTPRTRSRSRGALAAALTLLVASLPAGGAAAPTAAAARPQPAAQTPPPGDRPAPVDLALLRAAIEEFRNAAGIPGLAVAIVRAAEPVLVEGFGVERLDGGRVQRAETRSGDAIGAADDRRAQAVGPTTRFALGAAGEPFVSTVIASLVDRGVLHWDEPIDRWLPRFSLTLDLPPEDPDDLAAAPRHLSFRDLLLCRTGLMQMPVAWVGGAPPAPVVAAFRRAAPTATFRSRWQENAVGVAVAAHAAAVALRRGDAEAVSWSDTASLLAERLFEPLGMERTTIELSLVLAEDDRVVGHRRASCRAAAAPLAAVSPFDRPAVAASRGAWSTAADLARWLRFQLDRGRLDGTRLISRERIEETWAASAPLSDEGVAVVGVAPSTGAGMGWLSVGTPGDRLLLRSGALDGCAALIALLPDRDLGIALLASREDAPLAQLGLEVVLEALDGRAVAMGTIAAPEALEGTYRGDVFRNEVQVFALRGTLFIQATGQPALELRAPDPQGRRRVVGSDTAWVEFAFAPGDGARGADDGTAAPATPSASWLRFSEIGLTFEFARIGGRFEPEIAPDEAAPLLGRYHDPRIGQDVEVAISPEGRLQLRIPGQTAFDLRRREAGSGFAPGDASGGASGDASGDASGEGHGSRRGGGRGEERWTAAMMPGAEIRFEGAGPARATAILIDQRGERTTLPRIGEVAPQEGDPRAEGRALLRRVAPALPRSDGGGRSIEGRAVLPTQGIAGAGPAGRPPGGGATPRVTIAAEDGAGTTVQRIELDAFGYDHLTLRRAGATRARPWTGAESLEGRCAEAAALTLVVPHGLVDLVDAGELAGNDGGAGNEGGTGRVGGTVELLRARAIDAAGPSVYRLLVRTAHGAEAIIELGAPEPRGGPEGAGGAEERDPEGPLVIRRLTTSGDFLVPWSEPLDFRFLDHVALGDAWAPRRTIVEAPAFGRMEIEFALPRE
ncbi:MAG TPA: serine hydrolase domain-containing protein [Phycisphaerales bacterium]|nr:serine hydrolase domain-containing protein [Phycisphaerales bacterium]HMP36946.1 serine hydrolase domain-containing protein [Phycisphaerales bacterium]